MTTTRGLIVIATSLLLFGCGSAGVRSGTVIGSITMGGGPPPRPGVKLAGTVTVFSMQGKVIARHEVRKGHTFRFILPAGNYRINAGRQLHPKGGCDPKTVPVRAAQTTHVDVETDCAIA
jgi:hypothetical protein